MKVRLRSKVVVIYLGFLVITTFFLWLFVANSSVQKKTRRIDRTARDHVASDRAESDFGFPKLPENRPLFFEPDHAVKAEVRDVGPGAEALPPDAQVPEDDEEREEGGQVESRPQVVEVTISDQAALNNMSWPDLDQLYHKYVESVQYRCQDILRVGKVTDGGWEVCNDASVRPQQPCLVYSFGIDNDFSFDDAIVEKFQCEVHSFDPSMKIGDHRRSSHIFFHAKGLANFDGVSEDGWQMGTLAMIKKDLHQDKTPISILKLDIEEWEWRVLPQLTAGGGGMAASGKPGELSQVQQLLMELHACKGCSRWSGDADRQPSRPLLLQALSILRDLHTLGFRIFWSQPNSACRYVSRFHLLEKSACHHVHMVRVTG